MANLERRTTGFLKCNHCGNHAPMDIVAEYYLSTVDPEDEYYYPQPEAGYRYELLLCSACKEVTLWKYFDSDYLDPEEIVVATLYPSANSKLSGLPYPN